MWKNVVGQGRPQMTIWCMRIACWIPKTTNAHSEFVILFAFPLQWWLHKHASLLHYTYIASLVQFSWISLVILFCTFPLMMYWHPVPVVNTFTTSIHFPFLPNTSSLCRWSFRMNLTRQSLLSSLFFHHDNDLPLSTIYKGWSKSFQTGAAICTAVVLAPSSGRW